MNLLALLALMAGAVADTAVVCPAEFRPALAPWVALRKAQGHAITFLPPAADAAAMREAIRRAAAQQAVHYVLLVGDTDSPRRMQPGEPASAIAKTGRDASAIAARGGLRIVARGAVPDSARVPTQYAPARVNVLFGSEPDIATDNGFADLDDDGAPEIAIGRLTADTPEELAVMVRKILAYEANRDFGLWRREVHFVAGVGGFGPLIDSAVEMAAKSVIAAGLPSSYHAVMTQTSWTSPYFPDPRAFRQTALAGLADGCLFWVYMGHGQRGALDLAPAYAGRSDSILDTAAARRLPLGQAPAIACLFACYAGAFDGADDCLGEELLRAPGGPVAVLGASRVTMPYGMAVLGTELLAETFVAQRPTLGDALLAAKRAANDSRAKTSLRKSLDTMARMLGPAPVDLAAERSEHLAMFNLLGDPLLTLKHPRPITLRVAGSAAAGSEVLIEGVSPIAGAGLVEIVVRRDRLRCEPEQRSAPPDSAAEAARCGETYREANDPTWVRQAVKIDRGEFSVKLRLPTAARGSCHARMFVGGLADFAAGAADLDVTPSEASLPSGEKAGPSGKKAAPSGEKAARLGEKARRRSE